MEYLFTYGTLQDSDVQTRILGRVVDMQDDVLEGFRKGKIELSGRTYFAAVRDQASHITGKVLAATPKDMAAMDEYETKAYKRVRVTLRSGMQAWVYCQR